MPQHLGAASPAGFPPDLVMVLEDMADSLKEIAATLKRLENKAKQAAMLSMSRRAKALGVPVTTLLEWETDDPRVERESDSVAIGGGVTGSAEYARG